MRFARWLEKKADDLELNYYAPGARFKLLCLRVLTFIAQRLYWDQYNYYVLKAGFFRKYAACCQSLADSAVLVFVCRRYDGCKRKYFAGKTRFFRWVATRFSVAKTAKKRGGL